MKINWVTPYDTPYPGGMPMSWRYEAADLPGAVQAYLEDQTGGKPCSPEQVELVRMYFEQWVNAPCWTESCAMEESCARDLETLRLEIRAIKTADGLHSWTMKALDLGLDPL